MWAYCAVVERIDETRQKMNECGGEREKWENQRRSPPLYTRPDKEAKHISRGPSNKPSRLMCWLWRRGRLDRCSARSQICLRGRIYNVAHSVGLSYSCENILLHVIHHRSAYRMGEYRSAISRTRIVQGEDLAPISGMNNAGDLHMITCWRYCFSRCAISK